VTHNSNYQDGGEFSSVSEAIYDLRRPEAPPSNEGDRNNYMIPANWSHISKTAEIDESRFLIALDGPSGRNFGNHPIFSINFVAQISDIENVGMNLCALKSASQKGRCISAVL
jgi:hypothetical protein